MIVRDHPQIAEAEALFREAERLFPSLESVHRFKDGFSVLSDLLTQEADLAAIEVIANLKRAYTRSLLNRFDKIESTDLLVYVHYYVLLKNDMAAELKAIKLSDPEAARKFDQTNVRFGPQLDQLIFELRQQQKS